MDRIAYYAHHVGSGHLEHARNVARSGVGEVLVLTSAPTHNEPFEVVELTPDVVEEYKEPFASPFHYSPVAPNIRKRFKEIHDALARFKPDVVISDVSAEVAAFCRLSGYPVITRRQHGSRNDRPHVNMYDGASALLAYYPEQLETEALLPRHREKTFFAGMLMPVVPAWKPEVNHVVVLTSLGGDGIDIAELEKSTTLLSDWRWTIAGKTHGKVTQQNISVLGTVEDPAELLSTAALIACSAGHNAVRAAAAAGPPVITFPEQRPHDEQLLFSHSLHEQFGIPSVSNRNQNWPLTFADALRVDMDAVRGELFTNSEAFATEVKNAISFALNA